MMNLKSLLLAGGLLLTPVMVDASIFFTVKGHAVRNPDSTVTYTYTVTNNSWTNVVRPAATCHLEIGRAAYGNLPEHKPELTGLPTTIDPISGLRMHQGNGVLAMTAPTGWRGYEGGEEEDYNHTLVWETVDSGSPTSCTGLLPGQSINLIVTRAEASPSYLGLPRYGLYEKYSRTHYVITTTDSVRVYGMVERDTIADTIPPTLSVTLNPSTIAGSSPDRMYIIAPTFAVTANITAADNADSAPTIRLESMTLDGLPFTPIPYSLKGTPSTSAQDAVFDTDDRAFTLPLPSLAAVYTVTYSATDVTGNMRFATGRITVTAP